MKNGKRNGHNGSNGHPTPPPAGIRLPDIRGTFRFRAPGKEPVNVPAETWVNARERARVMLALATVDGLEYVGVKLSDGTWRDAG